jgi:hypothetical protein
MIRAELDDLGPHNGMGEPDAEGSYRALRLSEAGHTPDEEPQSLTFLVPSHSLGLHSLTEELEAVRDTLTSAGIVEIAARNPSVMEYMRHWEARAEKAEAERDGLSGTLRRLWKAVAWSGDEKELLRRVEKAEAERDFLAKSLIMPAELVGRAERAEAERGALAKALRDIVGQGERRDCTDLTLLAGCVQIARAALARLAP